MYHGDLNRDAGVVSLNIEALKAFNDTITIARYQEMVAESAKITEFCSSGGLESGRSFPFGRAHLDFMEYYNYENLKIACAFELHLKARLLKRDFVVHEIDGSAGFKDLEVEQRKRPIHRQRLLTRTEYHFDGSLNYLPGLKESSLKFSLIVEEPEYTEALELSATLLHLVQEYRKLRNMIHLPGDLPSTPFLASLQRPVAEILIEFMQVDLVDESEMLIAKHDLNPTQLNRYRARNA